MGVILIAACEIHWRTPLVESDLLSGSLFFARFLSPISEHPPRVLWKAPQRLSQVKLLASGE